MEINIKLGKNMLEAVGVDNSGIRLNISDVNCFENTQMFFEYVVMKWSERLKVNIDYEALKKHIVFTNEDNNSETSELHYFKNLHRFLEANKYFKKEQDINGEKCMVRHVPTYSIDCLKVAFVPLAPVTPVAGGGASA